MLHVVGVIKNDDVGYLIYDSNSAIGERYIDNIQNLTIALKSSLRNQPIGNAWGLIFNVYDNDILDNDIDYYRQLKKFCATLLDNRIEHNELYIKTSDGFTLADYAVKANDIKTLSTLIEHGYLNKNPHFGESALFFAAQHPDQLPCAKLLISHGVDVNSLSSEKQTALFIAAFLGNAEMVQLLLESEADPNINRGTDNRTALMAASGGGHTDIVIQLLKKGANVNSQVTCLQFAYC